MEAAGNNAVLIKQKRIMKVSCSESVINKTYKKRDSALKRSSNLDRRLTYHKKQKVVQFIVFEFAN